MTRVHITPKSSNGKVGKIPVTTSEAGTCPTTCPMWDGCYAKTGPQSWHWRKVTDGERGGTWDDLASFVSQLNAGQLWRHNVSGDLPYIKAPDGQELINLALLKQLVDANSASNAKGYTYSHHKLNTHNKEALKYATKNGFTINSSTETYSQADDVINQGLNAVTIIPSTDDSIVPYCSLEDHKVYYRQVKQLKTPEGRRIKICPAQTCVPTKCETCGLCSHQERNYPIGFIAHGNKVKTVNDILNK